MAYIDEKFKDQSPEKTVEKIQQILRSLDIDVEETWNDSGIENCWSLSVGEKNGYSSSNGKGVTKELARASAYAEYIERLQHSLHYYKLQSFTRDPENNLQTFAPDAKYMTAKEVEENGQWMDYLIQSYGGGLTRSKITKSCQIFAFAEKPEDKILTLPFYSIFEDKYVYLPAGFVEQVYVTNGCCAGNTREEAIVHAISEIFERSCQLELLLSGNSAPEIPNEVLSQFPTVMKILGKIRENSNYDVRILDISGDIDFPVVATCLIDKRTQDYVVNAGADPVLEIAVQRTLTETFQGRNVVKLSTRHSGQILNKIDDVPRATNAWNLLESSSALYTADFFAEEIVSAKKWDARKNENKSNSELLESVLKLCKDRNMPVHIRNYSYLGFPCYKVVVPGYSEGSWLQLLEPVSIYALGDQAAKVFRDAAAANKAELMLLLMYYKKIGGMYGRVHNFSRLSGIPLVGEARHLLPAITLAYACYKLGRFSEAIAYGSSVANSTVFSTQTREYIACVNRYLKLKGMGITEEKLFKILGRFFREEYVQKLYSHLERGETPYEDYLIRCDYKGCRNCRYADVCTYTSEKALIAKVGAIYSKFTNGQDKENFPSVE